MSRVANFFKKKDKLDYSRQVSCPKTMGYKRYFMEKNKNVCPACGEIVKNGNNHDGHYVADLGEDA